jgi:formylglycine-generating enzyme required for sulfatase activity
MAVQVNKKHIIIAGIAVLVLLSLFFILRKNNQNGQDSLINGQNSTINGQNALANNLSGQNDSNELFNSNTLGILPSADNSLTIGGINNSGNLLNNNSGNNSSGVNNFGSNSFGSNNSGGNNFENINLIINPDNELLFADENEEIEEVVIIKPYVAPIPSNMGLLQGGVFYMGSPVSEDEREEDEAQHRVVIRPFYIGKYEVTQKEYTEIMKTNPSFFVNNDFPVDNVTWFDAVEYCNMLSIRDGLPVAYEITVAGNIRIVTWDRSSIGYRLPTEAEWEYACRAGTTTPFNTGNSINRRLANYFNNTSVKVGSYPPNSWGLYDMHGNVSEWCWDWYTDYGAEVLTEANYAHMEGHRVFRGGSWFTLTRRVRSAFRDHYFPTYKSINIGFRIVRNYD